MAALPGAAPAGKLQWESGDHKVELDLITRFRVEWWDERASSTEDFTALRTRVGLRYHWRDRITAYGQFQDVRLNGLDSNSSGAERLYWLNSGMNSHASSDRMRQFWLQYAPTEDLWARVGRQDIKLGTEVMYSEANWKYLKVARASQRLVGTVGWSHAERSNDGFAVAYDLGDQHLFLWGARPTTGVFDIDSAYSQQDDIEDGGISWTAKRGAWLEDTEVRLFGIYYDDERKIRDGGLSNNHDFEVYTTGFSILGVRPVAGGPNLFDYLLWGAYQWGDSPDPRLPTRKLDNQAWAAIAELGYQCPEARGKPWFRGGINIASGDGSPTDGDQEGFFNILPTNHIYYGFADQFALANLIDIFGQLKFNPFPKMGVNLMLHRFQLFTSDDDRIFGIGAFNKTSFGYGRQASRGHRGLGTELDVVLDYKLHEHVSLQAGYAYLWGHGVFRQQGLPSSDDDTRFGYLQVTASY